MFCICQENTFGSASVSIGIVVVVSAREVIRDMEVEETGEVVAEEESMVTICMVGGEEARWTKIFTAGGEVEIIV